MTAETELMLQKQKLQSSVFLWNSETNSRKDVILKV